MMTDFARYTVRFYGDLELDGQPCFYPVGGMEVAYTEGRWEDLKRKAGVAKSWGVEAALLTPREAKDKIPLLDAKKIHGAYYVPGDGIAKAVRAGEAMARAAEARGAAFFGHTRVTGLEVKNGRVQAVLTSKGRIATERVLVCAGIWGPIIGRMAGVAIPLTPVQHQYTITSPLRELAGETREVVHPILRHQDYAMYFRQQADCYGIGSYKHDPLLVDPDDILSHGKAEVTPSILEFTPEHFEVAHAAAVDLLPPLRGVDLTYRINGMFSFTPDGIAPPGRVARRPRVLGGGSGVDHARRGCRQGDRGVDGGRGTGDRPTRGRPQPLSGPRPDPRLLQSPRRAAVPGSLRYHPSLAADGKTRATCA